MLEKRLVALADERRSYVNRLLTLVAGAGNEAEIAGYLDLINRVNDAAIRLARASHDSECAILH